MDRNTATGILNRNPWFAGLPQGLAKDIVRHGQLRRVKDAVVFAVGDEPNGLFAVLAGKVQISHTSADGRLALLLMANAGNWFGETSVLDGQRRYSEALAAGTCELLHLGMREFRQLSEAHVSHYAAFTRLLCVHHRLAMDHIASLDALPVAARLAQRLLFFARDPQGGPTSGDAVRLSQEKLASAIGVSRQALSGYLKDLERRGAISLGYGVIGITERAVLERMVNGTAISVAAARSDPRKTPRRKSVG